MKYSKRTRKVDVPLHIIHKSVCEYFEIDRLKIFSKSRKHEILRPRQWFHYFSRKLNPKQEVSLAYIGNYLSEESGVVLDHATVLFSFKTITGFIESYPSDADTETELLYLILKNTKITKIYEKPLTGNCAPMVFNNPLTINL